MMKPILFHLAQGCRIRLNGFVWTIEGVFHDKATLVRKDTGQKVSISRIELAQSAREGSLVFVDGPAAQPVTREARPVAWERLDDNKRARIAFRMSYVKPLLKLDTRSPQNPVFMTAVQEVARRRGDSPAPSPHTVYRWVLNYRASGYNTDALAKEFATKRGRSSRVPHDVRALIEEKLLQKMKGGATLLGIYDELMAEVAEELGYAGYEKPADRRAA